MRATEHANDAIARILRAHMLPSAFGPERHADPNGGRPTAVGRPWAPLSAPWFNRAAFVAGYESQFDSASMLALLRHDAKEHLLVTDFTRSRQVVDGGSALDSSQYQLYFDSGVSQSPTKVMSGGDWADPSCAYPVSGYYARHGPIYYCPRIGDRTAFIADLPKTGSSWANTRVVFNQSGTWLAANTYVWRVRCYQRGGFRDKVIAQVGSGNATLIVNLLAADFGTGGRFAVQYVGNYVTASGPTAMDTVTAVTTSVIFQQYCDGISVYPLPQLLNNEDSVDEIRLLGQSLMYTNEAGSAYRAGKRAQYQSPGSVPFDSWFYPGGVTGAPLLDAVGGSNGALTEDLTEGAYTFRKPGGQRDWDMVALDGPADNGGTGQTLQPPSDTVDYLVICLSAPVPASVQTTAQAGRFLYATGVEFETQDTWRAIATFNCDSTTYYRALQILKEADQHYTNNKHLQAIGRWISKRLPRVAAGAARRYLDGGNPIALAPVLRDLLE